MIYVNDDDVVRIIILIKIVTNYLLLQKQIPS